MTYEKAIKTIQIAIAEVEWNYPMDYVIAFDKAIEAMEKQIPKKPNKLNCPHCSFNGIDNSWWVFSFCPECGQAVDWSEEDD